MFASPLSSHSPSSSEPGLKNPRVVVVGGGLVVVVVAVDTLATSSPVPGTTVSGAGVATGLVTGGGSQLCRSEMF